MKSPNQDSKLASYKKISIGFIAGASAMGNADAAIVYFNVNPDQTTSGLPDQLLFGEINLGTGTYTLDANTGNKFTLITGYNNKLYNGVSGGNIIQWGASGTGYGATIPKLLSNAAINAAAFTAWHSGYYGYLDNNGSAPWTNGGDGYAGLRINAGSGNYNYGWVHIIYDHTTTTVTVSEFAFESTYNTTILAGAIPECSSALLTMAGLFGLALRRHRESPNGGAPTSLLQLASGSRGLEEMRKQKSA